ncbi:MAG: DUF885 domain-containing protein, partial [Anaeromyxobacteraceae bacterium]
SAAGAESKGAGAESKDAGAESKDAPQTASAHLAELSRRYLDGLFRAKPHLADYMGVRRFAGELADLSEGGVKRRAAELAAQRRELAGIDVARLTPDEKVDAAILADGLALELLELQEVKEWTFSPRLVDSFTFYDPREMVAERLSGLVHGTWGSEAMRMKAARAQLEALPRWLETKKAALRNVSKVHLDQGVKDNAGRIQFFETELAAFTRKDAAAEAARQRAAKALRDYQAFMEKELPRRARADWRLGAELYRRKFPLALQTDVAPDELSRLARTDFGAARAELLALSRRLAAELFPGEAAPPEGAPPAEEARLIARVKDALAKDHPAPDALVAASAEKLDGLRALVEAKRLVALPPKATLSVLPMPEYKRGATGAEYLSPDALDRTGSFHGTYYVDPVDPTWPKEKVESYLRANNDYQIALTAAHEALPGHHTQAWWARRDPSPLRATLWSGPFAEGWAVYGEGLVVQAGFGGARNDRYRFFDLRGRMIVAANAILDVALQGGAMKDEEALRFMIDDGFQERAQAEKKLLRAKLDSTQLCQYFLGRAEILRLEQEARSAGPFDQRAFDEALLGHGTIAVKHLRGFVLGR